MSGAPAFFESHAHIQYLEENTDDVLARARAVGVKRFVCVATDVPTMEGARKIAEAHNDVWFSSGYHPHEAGGWDDGTRKTIRAALNHPRSVAVGETGLDYFYDHAPRDTQLTVFKDHLALARETGKPLIMHCREAAPDLLQCLRDAGNLPGSGVVHCFTETQDVARELLDMGYYLGFTGIITFKNADPLRAIVKSIPMDRMLIETDTPYLAPIPHRGKKNEPAFVIEVARQVAQLRGITVAEVASKTWANASRLFAIKPN